MPGAPSMKMYSREDLMKSGFGNEDADDDDEDDNDEAHFPSNLVITKFHGGYWIDFFFTSSLFHIIVIILLQGKVLREKESAKGDWKQKITKGIKNTGEILKRHANKVSSKIQHWWKGAKKNSKTSKSEL